MPDIELLKVGHCFHPEAMVMKGHPWKPMLFPAVVGLLRHPSRGPVLFDTGYAHRFLDETHHFPNRLYRMLTPMHLDEGASLLRQLEVRGLGAEDIRYIFISHFHADHVSGLKDFPNATFLCSRAGLEAITSMGPIRGLMKGYLKNLLPPDFAARVRFIEDCSEVPLAPALAPFARGHDVLGDGGFFAISLPGHAHGHMGLLGEADRVPTFLVGDASWTREGITEGARPQRLANLLLSDPAAYRVTLDKLGELYGKNRSVRLIPSHCMKTFEDFTRP